MLNGKRVLVTGGTGRWEDARAAAAAAGSGATGARSSSSRATRPSSTTCGWPSPSAGRRPPTRSSTTTSQQLAQFRIGDVRDYASRAARRSRDADIVFNAAALKQVPTCEYFPVAGGAHQHRWARRTSCARSASSSLPVETVDRHLHRQGVQAGQRHGHDQGDAGAHLHRRPTCDCPRPASSASATATCWRRAAR